MNSERSFTSKQPASAFGAACCREVETYPPLADSAGGAAGNLKPLWGIRHPAAAFTLVEILLAIVILAIVLTTIMASFNTVFSSTGWLDRSIRTYDMAKNCLERMTLDLGAIYINEPPLYKPPTMDTPPDMYQVVGSETDVGGTGFATLRFTSRAHVPFEKSARQGIAEIVYYVSAKNDGQPELKRADHLYPYPSFEEKSADPVLCKHVKSLAFKYYDEQGDAFEQWDSESPQFGYATPTAITIVLEIGDNDNVDKFETTVRLPVWRRRIEP